jgi:hypothetical protein
MVSIYHICRHCLNKIVIQTRSKLIDRLSANDEVCDAGSDKIKFFSCFFMLVTSETAREEVMDHR